MSEIRVRCVRRTVFRNVTYVTLRTRLEAFEISKQLMDGGGRKFVFARTVSKLKALGACAHHTDLVWKYPALLFGARY